MHGAATGPVERVAMAEFSVSDGYTASSPRREGTGGARPLILGVHDLIPGAQARICVLIGFEWGRGGHVQPPLWKCPCGFA